MIEENQWKKKNLKEYMKRDDHNNIICIWNVYPPLESLNHGHWEYLLAYSFTWYIVEHVEIRKKISE